MKSRHYSGGTVSRRTCDTPAKSSSLTELTSYIIVQYYIGVSEQGTPAHIYTAVNLTNLEQLFPLNLTYWNNCGDKIGKQVFLFHLFIPSNKTKQLLI